MAKPKTCPTKRHHRQVLPPPSPRPMSDAAICYQHVLSPYDEAMDLMAEFECIEHTSGTVDMDAIKRLYDRLQLAAQKMMVALGDLGDRPPETGDRGRDRPRAHEDGRAGDGLAGGASEELDRQGHRY